MYSMIHRSLDLLKEWYMGPGWQTRGIIRFRVGWFRSFTTKLYFCFQSSLDKWQASHHLVKLRILISFPNFVVPNTKTLISWSTFCSRLKV